MSVLVLLVGGFICAWCNAAFGAGGGVLLFALLGNIVPYADVNPMHALAQIFNNLHRAMMRKGEIHWNIVFEFARGCILGAAIAMSVPLSLPENLLQVGFGVVIMGNVLTSDILRRKGVSLSLFLAGLIQGSLSPYVGILGGVTASALLSHQMSHEERATNIAATALILNIGKMLVFLVWGIQLFGLVPMTLILLAATSLGTYVGLYHSEKIDNQKGVTILKIIIILTGLKMIFSGLFNSI